MPHALSFSPPAVGGIESWGFSQRRDAFPRRKQDSTPHLRKSVRVRQSSVPTLSAIISLCLLAAQVMAITIDGEMSDWKGAAVYEMPQRAVENAGMPFGVVEQLQVTHDEQFLYFRIRFARARLFADEAQSRWPDRYRSSMRYIVLDTDGDAEPDYHTNQIARSDVGLDRTYVVRSTEEGLRETCLWFEDHPDWNDGPRGPLGIGQDVVGIRLQMV